MYQQTTVIGNVGRDAELSYTPQGIAVAKFSVAVSKVTGKGENKKEKTTWFKIILWRERAENLSQYIHKGDKIMVVGEIDVSAYTDKSGNPTAYLELTANEIKFLSSKNDSRGPAHEGDASSYNGEYEEIGDIPF